MNLHEQMLDDLDRVFLNLDEFACIHLFRGKELVCIVDDAESLADTGSSGGFANQSGIGLLSCERLVHCRACDLVPVPLAGERVEMDNSLWIVGDGVKETEGLLTLPLNRAY